MRFDKRLIRKTATSLPHWLQDQLRDYYSASGLDFSLRRLRQRGFQPAEIVDCGAYEGHWARVAKRVFPKARVLMVEAQPAKRPFLERVRQQYGPSADFVIGLLGPERKEAVPFFEMETGSSVLWELGDAPRRQVMLPMRTLDDVLAEKNLRQVNFLKLDLQGYELEVLKGATETMNRAEVILSEVSFLPYNQSAPLFNEVVRFLAEKGFVLYDICALQRLSDQALFQADVLFVKTDSALRKTKA